MLGHKNPGVIVIGAGPVGLFTALELANNEIEVVIIDQERRAAAHSYALALHPKSLSLLEEVGLLEKALEKSFRVDTVGVYDARGKRGVIPLSRLQSKFPFLAIMPQNVLEGLLEEALDRKGVKVLWNHQAAVIRPRSDRVEVTVDRLSKESMGYPIAKTEWVVSRTTDYEVPFVIGADGYESDVRRTLSIDFPSVGPSQYFAVFEFESDADLGSEVRIIFDKGGTNVLWPLKNKYCRWSFELENFDVPAVSRSKDRFVMQLGDAVFPVLAEAELEPLISERAPWFLGKIDEIHWRISVRFEKRLATEFGRNRLWLVGDAAHMTGPVGVQSMNVGLKEAKELASILSRILKQGASREELNNYNENRLKEWRHLLGLDEWLTPTEKTDPFIAENAKRLLPCIPASGDDLEELAKGLNLL